VRVLLVDDDRTSQIVLTASVEELGHVSVCAADGDEAWGILQTQSIHVVITDWLMPRLNGVDLCRRIRSWRSRPSYLYVILLTVLQDKASYLKGMDAGADDFLSKPLDTDQLGARLRVAERIVNMQTRLDQLQGLLPICCYCHDIRDENGVWHALESYIASRTRATFSHSICPGCYTTHVQPDLDSMEAKVRPASIPEKDLCQPL